MFCVKEIACPYGDVNICCMRNVLFIIEDDIVAIYCPQWHYIHSEMHWIYSCIFFLFFSLLGSNTFFELKWELSFNVNLQWLTDINESCTCAVFLFQVLVCRNYRGDVDMSEIEHFMTLLMDKEEEGTLSPILAHGGVRFMWIKHNNLYCILINPWNTSTFTVYTCCTYSLSCSYTS